MSVIIDGSVGITFPDSSIQTVAGGYGFKNRIINGAMVIDQRNAGASFTPTDQTYSLDRWKCRLSQASKYTVQQNAGSITPPTGYRNYLGVTVGASANVTIGTNDFFAIQQVIEGYNVADLNLGLSTASSFTISFWVRSSVTGTYGGALNNGAEVRAYGFTYTISSANTWEQKTITIAGDQSGTWLTTNGIGLYVNFNLGTGSTYGSATNGSWTNGSTQFTPTGCATPITTNGATFYITGVQLEKGSTATSFDYRPYGTELALCQRYYIYFTPAQYMYFYDIANTVYRRSSFSLPVQMRVTPTVYATSGVTGNSAGPTVDSISVNSFSVSANGSSSGSLVYWDSPAYVTLGAEL